MRYAFHYFVAGSPAHIAERRALATDGEARVRAAQELLQMPGRTGVDVWAGERLVYRRHRQGACLTGDSQPAVHELI